MSHRRPFTPLSLLGVAIALFAFASGSQAQDLSPAIGGGAGTGIASAAGAQVGGASLESAAAGAICLTCADYRPGECSWAGCVRTRTGGWSYCFADNVVGRCDNGCWIDIFSWCGIGAIQLDGTVFATNEVAGEDPALLTPISTRSTIGASWSACGDVIVQRKYDAEAARRVRTSTARIEI